MQQQLKTLDRPGFHKKLLSAKIHMHEVVLGQASGAIKALQHSQSRQLHIHKYITSVHLPDQITPFPLSRAGFEYCFVPRLLCHGEQL